MPAFISCIIMEGCTFDTDVEVIRPMDDLVGRGAFMGCENEAKPGATALAVAPGLGLGCNPGLGLGCNPGLGLGCIRGLAWDVIRAWPVCGILDCIVDCT